MIVAGYILSIYKHVSEESRSLTPGSTPVRRRDQTLSQTQKTFDNTTTPSTVDFSQQLVSGELAQQMFA